MANSTHKVEVFRVQHLGKHPNADKLNIMRVFDNYQAVVRIGEFQVGDLACYVPPDNILPDTPEFEWLKKYKDSVTGEWKLSQDRLRIKASKLRGVISQGIVLKAPVDAQEGDDVAEQLGITHYVAKPGRHSGGSGGGGNHGAVIADPPNPGQKYDLDTWFKYGSLIPDGTLVEITEKLDGGNTRASYQNGEFWMGSREYYRKEDGTGLYWRVMHENPWLRRLCKANPECIVYGEVFGNVQALKYGAEGNQVWFRVFDILTPKGYMNHAQKMAALKASMVPNKWEVWKNRLARCFGFWPFSPAPKPLETSNWEQCYVPIYYIGPYNFLAVQDLMDGLSMIPGAKHLREGIVIKPLEEMWHPHIGRLVLKAVSPEHLDKDHS